MQRLTLGNTGLTAGKTLLILGLGLITPLNIAASQQPPSLQGPTFTDPAKTTEKKQAWIDQEIIYDENIKDADLVISLGQQTWPALHKVVEEIAAKRGINVVIQQGSCGKTAKKLKRKAIDIGAYCCPPGKGDRLPGLEFHTIAITPLIFVTHPSNPLNNITSIEAQNIFRGEYALWSELPSAKQTEFAIEKIQPVVRLHCKKRPGHWRHLLKNEDLMSPRIFEVAVIPDMIKQVASNTSAIGIETPFMLEVHKKQGDLKILNINGHNPAQAQYLLNGEYPIYRTYNLTTWKGDGTNHKLANEFVQEVKAHIEAQGDRYGFIPVSKLKDVGWKFNGDELIAEPDNMPVIH